MSREAWGCGSPGYTCYTICFGLGCAEVSSNSATNWTPPGICQNEARQKAPHAKGANLRINVAIRIQAAKHIEQPSNQIPRQKDPKKSSLWYVVHAQTSNTNVAWPSHITRPTRFFRLSALMKRSPYLVHSGVVGLFMTTFMRHVLSFFDFSCLAFGWLCLFVIVVVYWLPHVVIFCSKFSPGFSFCLFLSFSSSLPLSLPFLFLFHHFSISPSLSLSVYLSFSISHSLLISPPPFLLLPFCLSPRLRSLFLLFSLRGVSAGYLQKDKRGNIRFQNSKHRHIFLVRVCSRKLRRFG